MRTAKHNHHAGFFIEFTIVCMMGVMMSFNVARGQNHDDRVVAASSSEPPATTRIARLVYGQGKQPSCFSAGFLQTVIDHGKHRVEPHFTAVFLDSDEPLQPYPLLLWAGEGRFTLSEKERQRLRDYVDQGGFILASASCADAAWGDSFRTELKLIWPAAALTEITAAHSSLQQGVTPLDKIEPRLPTKLPLVQAMQQGDRLVLVFSPVGLHDTDNAGPGCCCCGGNEIRNARIINANLLLYVLSYSDR